MRPVNLRAARRHVERRPYAPWRRLRLPGPWKAAALVAVVLAAGTPWWPTLAHQLKLTLQREAGLVLVELELHGAAQLDVRAVQETLNLRPGMPLFELDVHEARARLETLGWVERASVRRQLPDRLVVEIKEHRPLGLWFGDDGPALVAASGLPVATDRLADHLHLPRLVGDDAPAEAPALIQALAAAPDLLARLERLERLPAERWRLRFQPGVTVELPPGDTAQAVARLIAVEREMDLFGRAVAVIDLRVADRVVVTPWPRVQPAAAATRGAT